MTQFAKSVRDLAQHLGIGKSRAGQLLKEGRLPPPGPQGYDVEACRRAYGTSTDHDASQRQKVNARRGVETRRKNAASPAPIGSGEAAKAIAALSLQKARLAKVRLDVARGDLIDLAAASDHLSAAISAAKGRCIQLQPQLLSILRSTHTSADLQAAIYAALTRLSERFADAT